MPILRNARHEAFAQALVGGMSLGQANIAAGYKNGNRKAAWITRQSPKIAARITELTEEKLAAEKLARERAQAKFDLSAERVIGELARIGFANMQDYLSMDANGDPHLDYARISRDQAAAISEITIDEYKEGKGADAKPVKRVRIKLSDKRAALEALGRHLGLFVDPSVLNVNMANFFSEAPPSMSEWRREIEVQSAATSIPPQPLSKR
jgi:phage terminase small subunit